MEKANVKKVSVNFVVNKNEDIENPKRDIESEINEKLKKAEEEIEKKLEEANRKYEEIIESSKKEIENLKEKIKEEAKQEALLESEEIKKQAYEEGYEEGQKNGYEDGYKEAYEENIEKAKLEATNIIDLANEELKQSKEKVVSYLKENQKNIVNLILEIAEKVLREKFDNPSSINSLVTEVINEYELKQNFVIRLNPIYKENIENELEALRKTKKINDDVFVLVDENIKEGNLIIDTENGKITTGIDTILEKIKEELL